MATVAVTFFGQAYNHFGETAAPILDFWHAQFFLCMDSHSCTHLDHRCLTSVIDELNFEAKAEHWTQ